MINTIAATKVNRMKEREWDPQRWQVTSNEAGDAGGWVTRVFGQEEAMPAELAQWLRPCAAELKVTGSIAAALAIFLTEAKNKNVVCRDFGAR